MGKKTSEPADANNSMRVDKWLWCARFYKTRRLASDAIKAGRIKVNGMLSKTSTTITTGNQLTIKRGSIHLEIDILQLSPSRLGAKSVAELYIETQASIDAREKSEADIKRAHQAVQYSRKKPDKRARRELLKFTGRAR